MIPASYLFRNAYRQAWEEPGAVPHRSRRHHVEGLMSPLAAAVSALLAWRPRPAPVQACTEGPAA
jgi:hypothetical protein